MKKITWFWLIFLCVPAFITVLFAPTQQRIDILLTAVLSVTYCSYIFIIYEKPRKKKYDNQPGVVVKNHENFYSCKYCDFPHGFFVYNNTLFIKIVWNSLGVCLSPKNCGKIASFREDDIIFPMIGLHGFESVSESDVFKRNKNLEGYSENQN